MKAIILKKLKQIEKLAKSTEIKGEISIEFEGVNVDVWDSAIDSITEYPRYKHFVTVCDGLTVKLLLG